MQVKSIADCPNGEHCAILSPFMNLSFGIKIFCLFLSDRFTQVLLFLVINGPDVLKYMASGHS